MMLDLFSDGNGFENIDLPGADVKYARGLQLRDSTDILLARLINETPWRQETVVVWGKTHQQPRLVAWYGDPGKAYSYSGIRLEPLIWTDTISTIRAVVEEKCCTNFNSVLLNYYRDGSDSMGFHSDDEPELGARPTIASVSLGAERALTFKSKADNQSKPVKVVLESGSLLLMQGDTQKLYKHGISKEKGIFEPRINLTFRQISR